MAETLLHGDEATAHGDRGYADKTREPDRPREEDAVGPRWFAPLKRKTGCDTTEEQKRLNRLMAALRSAVEHPFRVLRVHPGSCVVLTKLSKHQASRSPE